MHKIHLPVPHTQISKCNDMPTGRKPGCAKFEKGSLFLFEVPCLNLFSLLRFYALKGFMPPKLKEIAAILGRHHPNHHLAVVIISNFPSFFSLSLQPRGR